MAASYPGREHVFTVEGPLALAGGVHERSKRYVAVSSGRAQVLHLLVREGDDQCRHVRSARAGGAAVARAATAGRRGCGDTAGEPGAAVAHRRGFPLPETQIAVVENGQPVAFLAMGWPECKVAIDCRADVAALRMTHALGWAVVPVADETGQSAG